MLYDYFAYIGYIGLVGYGLLTTVCLGAFLYLLVPFIRWIRRGVKGAGRSVAVYAMACVAPLVVAIGLVPQAVGLFTALSEAANAACPTVTGVLESVAVEERAGYRGGAEYAVSFSVAGVTFPADALRTDRETADRIAARAGERVTVTYTEEAPVGEGGWLVYRMDTAPAS